MGLTHADETLRSGTVIPTTFVERMNLCGYKSTRRGWFKLSLELQVLSAFYKSNVLHFSKLYHHNHHHHIRRKASNAGHRAPPRFAEQTGSAPSSTNAFPRPYPGRRSINAQSLTSMKPNIQSDS